ncbi:3-epi-6-deoxocathasterone 23-monooxygenase [Tanacetum coccineum]
MTIDLTTVSPASSPPNSPPFSTLFDSLRTVLDQDSVRLLAVEGCASLGKLLKPENCVAHILPVIVNFSQLEMVLDGKMHGYMRGQFSKRWLNRKALFQSYNYWDYNYDSVQKYHLNAARELNDKFLNGLDMVSRFCHKNIITYIGYCDGRKESGDTRFYGKDHAPSIGARGLKCLHSGLQSDYRVVRKNVNSECILLDANMEAKVSFLKDLIKVSKIKRKSDIDDVKVDVYSFGFVMLEMLSGMKKSDSHNDSRLEIDLSITEKETLPYMGEPPHDLLRLQKHSTNFTRVLGRTIKLYTEMSRVMLCGLAAWDRRVIGDDKPQLLMNLVRRGISQLILLLRIVHFDGGTPAIANDIKKSLGGNDDTVKIDALKNAISLFHNGRLCHNFYYNRLITFLILVKLLMSVKPGEYMEFLKIEFMEAIKVDDRKSAMEKNESKGSVLSNDVIDVLLWDIGESDGSQQRLPLDFISGNIIEMMIPGEYSVPMIMTLAIKYLSDNPPAFVCLVVKGFPEDPTLVDHEDGLNPPLSNIDADATFILLIFVSSFVLFEPDKYDEFEKMDVDLINVCLSVYNPTGSEKMAT